MSRYDEVVRWLFGLEAAKGMDFKLERVELALERLGGPHRRFPCIHIAGTNGKGSVAAMCAAVLTAAGHSTGLYISPHLSRLTERVTIDGEEIDTEAVVALVDEIRREVTSRGIDLTFFELLTVLAFLHFARRGAGAAVIEVGLGGRLDATNVVRSSVAVVTTIGFDHREWLGDTLAQIAVEKGGILEPGRPAVLGRLRPEAEQVLETIAAERGCPLVRLGREFELAGAGPFEYRGRRWTIPGLVPPLRGAHQADNTAVAVAALEAAATELALTPEHVRAGLARVRWPGRFEVLPGMPQVVLDCAHNPDGAAALAAEVRSFAAGRGVHLLFAVMNDKDWPEMVRLLGPLARSVTVTALPPRGAAPEEVARAFAPFAPVEVVAEPSEAFARVLAAAGAEDVVLVTGSLFLVGALQPAVDALRAHPRAQPAAT